MNKTLKCTNPACQTFITVPEGAMQVICPNCNTWHFPSAIEEGTGNFQSSDNRSIGYDAPPDSTGNSSGYQDAVDPLPIANAYVPPTITEEPVAPGVPQTNSPEALAYLLTQRGERLMLREGKNVIGRKNVDLILDDRTVSRRHCVIEVNANSSGVLEFLIYDIGNIDGNPSTNGVFISGRSLRLQEYERLPIGADTAIKIGKVNVELKVLSQ